jgi:ABC-type uncharacterized transport system involved in gliding motility auxiliary subunit
MASRSFDRRSLAIGGLVLAAVLFIAVNVFSTTELRNVRVDLTQGGLYTLSDGTRKILASVREPITLRLFVSRSLTDMAPGLAAYSGRVRELLERYVALSNGKITLQLIQPEAFSPEEDRAVGFNLQGIPLDQTGATGYFGLAGTNTTDDVDVIAFLSPQRERFLEYDLTRLVNNLANPKKPVIGLFTTLSLEADPAKQYKPWYVMENIRQLFEVKTVGWDGKPIPDDLDLLLVIHPVGLDDKQLYAIDQYVMKGGKAIVMVDPYSEEGSRSNAMQRMPPDMGSDMNKLFKAWGIEYDKSKIAGDRIGAQRVSAGNDPAGRPIIADYLAWVTLDKSRMKADDVITGDLQLINIASAGFVDLAKGSTLKMDPLLTTSPQSEAIDASKVRVRPNPAQILKDFKPGNKPLVVAARFTGKVKSAFPDGPPKDEKKDADKAAAKPEEAKPADAGSKDKAPAALTESKGDVNLIVVADTDLLADTFWLQSQDFFGQQLVVPTANNGDFIVNAIDNLRGSAGLIALRSRGVSSRPFDTVQSIQREAEIKYRAKEQQLAERLKDVESKLKDIQTKETPGGAATILSDQQRQTIDNFRREMVTIRGELREVQYDLKKDVDGLDMRMKLLNIGLMPFVVLVFAVGLGLYRHRRARRHIDATG